MSSTGGGIVVHAQSKPHDHHHLSKEEVEAILSHLPDGPLKDKWQAILASLD